MRAKNVRIHSDGGWGTGTGMAQLKIDNCYIVLQKDYDRKDHVVLMLGEGSERIQSSWTRFVAQHEKNMMLIGKNKNDWGTSDLVLDLFWDFYREERKAERAAERA